MSAGGFHAGPPHPLVGPATLEGQGQMQCTVLEKLYSVPADARMIYEHDPTWHLLLNVGAICAEAAAEIVRLREALEWSVSTWPKRDDDWYRREHEDAMEYARSVLKDLTPNSDSASGTGGGA